MCSHLGCRDFKDQYRPWRESFAHVCVGVCAEGPQSPSSGPCVCVYVCVFIYLPVWVSVYRLLSAGANCFPLWSLYPASRGTNGGVLQILRLFFCLTPPQLIQRSTPQTASATNAEPEPINEHTHMHLLRCVFLCASEKCLNTFF